MSNPCANLLVGTKPTRGLPSAESENAAIKAEQVARALRAALAKPEATNGPESATARAMRMLEARAKPMNPTSTSGPQDDVDSVSARIARMRMLATSAPVEEEPEHVRVARNTLNFLESTLGSTNGMVDDEPTGGPEDDDDFIAKPSSRECLNKLGAIEDFKRIHASGGVMAFHVGDGKFRITAPVTGRVKEFDLNFMQHMVKCATHGCYEGAAYPPCKECAHKF